MAEQRPTQSGGQFPAPERSPEGRTPAHEVGTHLAQTARQVGETASAYYDQGRETMEAYEGYLEERIRAKPLQCIAIAAGVGLLFGLLWKK
jgi:ElaB/YqjD/DUF883 family membrane-anchored ribosome-binding protein